MLKISTFLFNTSYPRHSVAVSCVSGDRT